MWTEEKKAILVIGNICTDENFKGFGVGTKLLNQTIKEAIEEAKKDSRVLRFTVSEAETASLGFWAKNNFLSPQNLIYIQPCLIFDKNGDALTPEVEENFLLKPHRKTKSIKKKELDKIVRTIFDNWYLKCRDKSFKSNKTLLKINNEINRVCETITNSIQKNQIELSPIFLPVNPIV